MIINTINRTVMLLKRGIFPEGTAYAKGDFENQIEYYWSYLTYINPFRFVSNFLFRISNFQNLNKSSVLFEFWSFGFISYFEFRYSDFAAGV